MTAEDRAALLRLARAAIASELEGPGSLDSARRAIDPDGPLGETRATFVTLRAPGDTARPELRGCIGTLEAREALHESVVRNARRAAFHDPRFEPVTAAELDRLTISISVLTPTTPIDSPDRIEPGRDGVRLDLGPHRAVFLPEVATDHGWDRDELLRQLARKAGIRGGDWRGARLGTFRTESFGE
jgi:AmmeMemoRadiSam system protein A